MRNYTVINTTAAVNISDNITNSINNISDTNSNVNLDTIGEPSDIISGVSNDYDFIKAISQNQYAVDSVQKTLITEKALDEFSYETELVGKVASIAVQGVNTLVKMQ